MSFQGQLEGIFVIGRGDFDAPIVIGSSPTQGIAMNHALGVVATKTFDFPGVPQYFGYRVTTAFNYNTLTAQGVLGLSWVTDLIQTAVLGNAGGTGYAVGDIVSVTQAGGSGGQLVITSVNAGVVTGVAILAPGDGYAAASNLATVALTGGGNNALTVTITCSQLLASMNLVDGTPVGMGGRCRVPVLPPVGVYRGNALSPLGNFIPGDQLVISITNQATGGTYIAGYFFPYIIGQYRGASLADQATAVFDQTPASAGISSAD